MDLIPPRPFQQAEGLQEISRGSSAATPRTMSQTCVRPQRGRRNIAIFPSSVDAPGYFANQNPRSSNLKVRRTGLSIENANHHYFYSFPSSDRSDILVARAPKASLSSVRSDMRSRFIGRTSTTRSMAGFAVWVLGFPGSMSSRINSCLLVSFRITLNHNLRGV